MMMMMMMMMINMKLTESTDHICVSETARLDYFQKVTWVSHVPAGDAADALKAVHDVTVDTKRVARLGNCCIVWL